MTESLSRELTTTANLLDDNHILAFYQRFAWADVKDTKLEWSCNMAMGGAAIALDVKLPDGTKFTEVVNLSEMLTEWGKQALAERGITA